MKSELSDQLIKKKAEMEHMLERTSEVRRMKDNLQQTLQQVFCEIRSCNIVIHEGLEKGNHHSAFSTELLALPIF